MKKSQLDKLIREEIKKTLKEGQKPGPGEGTPGSEMIFSPLEDDMIDDWRNDPQIKKWGEEGRVALQMLAYDSWEIWAVEGDKEVEDYVKKHYAW